MGEPITETQVNITSFTMGPQWVLAGGRNDGEYLVNRETKERQAIDMYKLISILLTMQERKKGVKLKCQRCGYVWIYAGENPIIAPCSRCKTSVSIKKNRID